MKDSLHDRQTRITRRQVLGGAAATAALVGLPYVRTAHSAGQVTLGIWDHWVPGDNDVMKSLCDEWGKKNSVEVKIDFITSIGSKTALTAAAEARAKTGHDIVDMATWQPTIHRDNLEPVDKEIKHLVDKYGPMSPDGEYLFKLDGTWMSLPAPAGGNHSYPMVSRLDYFKQYAGVDLKKIFPANKNRDKALVEAWNLDNFLKYAEKLHAAGHDFGNPIGPTSDSQDWLCPLFRSFGSIPVDEKGKITFDSDATRMALEYMVKLTKFMPPDVYAWDDAGNNRWIISGKGSAIQNPPSAWTVAKRDQPKVAEQIWHHDVPRGPKGRFRGSLPRGNGIWKFAKNKSAAKELLVWLLEKDQQFKLITASQGYDIPLFPAFNDHPIWSEIGPPVGGQYNYPVRGDEHIMTGGTPAPQAIGAQIYLQALVPNTVAKVTKEGKSINEAIKWAVGELEGFKRG